MNSPLDLKKLIIFTILALVIPMGYSETTIIGNMDIYWSLTGEITNLYPYSVFVAVPDNITYSEKTLKSSQGFLTVNLIEDSSYYDMAQPDKNYITTLNGKKGFWIPPYTTVKIKIYGNMTNSLVVDNTQGNFNVSGPGVVASTKIANLKEIFPVAERDGIKLNNFKLYVRGTIKKENTDVLGVIIPAPIVLKDYYRFNKIMGRYNTDIWIDSYSEWVADHTSKRKYYTEYNSWFLDNSLIPTIGYEINTVSLRPFDIPAISYTTSSSKDVEFSYKMYWKEKSNKLYY